MATRVYLVDPNLYSRSILRDVLMTHGFSICGESASGEEALENYERLHPDVLVVAASTRDLDGLATIKALRHHHLDVKAIFAASAGQRSLVVEALAAGAIDFIAKPYSARRVIATIRKHFG